MATVWDVVGSVDALVVDTQQTRVRPKPKTAAFSVIAVAAGAMFCATEAPIVTRDSGWVSSTVISVRSVSRIAPATTRPLARRARDQYAPDARDGLSTHRLAQTFTALFTPVEEASADVEYRFG